MYRALPTNNKLIHKKWVDRCQAIHRDNLKNAKSTVNTNARKFMDCSLPETSKMVHLNLRLKKLQKESERYAQIERENTILLSKISAIMQTDTLSGQAYEYAPGIRLNANQYPILDNVNHNDIKSLNKEIRKRELMRITAENQAILRRIQCKEPHYDHVKWEDERRQAEELLKNICEFEYTPRSAKSRSGNRTPMGDGRMTARSDRSNASMGQTQPQPPSRSQTAGSAVSGGPKPPDGASKSGGPRSQKIASGRSSAERAEAEKKKEEEEEKKEDGEVAEAKEAAADPPAEETRARKQPKDRLSEEEQRRLRVTFDKFDKDTSGSIEMAEFTALLDALGYACDEAAITQFFAQRDQDRDGKISFSEFSNWYALEKYYCLSEQEYNDLKTVFDEFDTDKSGQIDVGELTNLLKAMGKPSSQEIVDAVLADRDWDASKTVSIDEFVFWYYSNKYESKTTEGATA